MAPTIRACSHRIVGHQSVCIGGIRVPNPDIELVALMGLGIGGIIPVVGLARAGSGEPLKDNDMP